LFIANAIAIPFTMISAIGAPLLSNYWKNNDTKSITALYKSSSTSILVFSLLTFLSLWMGLDDLFMLMPKGNEYKLAKSIVMLLCLAKIIDMGMGINGQIIAMSDQYKTQLWFLLITAILNVGLNWLLIPKYGLEGSGIATVVSIVVFNLLKYWFLKIKYNMSPFTKETYYIIATGVGLYFIINIFPKTSNSLVNLLIYPSSLALTFSLISYKLHFAPEINEFVNKQLRRFGMKPFD
jgi:O-antigen/teichoic acid export membrane protein